MMGRSRPMISHRPHPVLYAVIAMVAVSAAVANVVSAFSSAPSGEVVFVASPAPETLAATGTAEEPEAPAVETVRLIDIPSAETLFPPIGDAAARVTKKPFGIEIHPQTSPVPGDRFDGFHVGVDFETFADEAETDVPVYAACEGPLLFKQRARGYGGVAVQRCNLDGKGVVVIYGHLRLESVAPRAGQVLRPGERIAVLGTGHSEETDGVRKHLHFGIHESATSTDIRGYVKTEAETGEWLDALEYIAP